ncbi:hypothetical protein GCM10009627_32590 [Curtobacterium herbarum]|uniref:Uncharacterized protein n=1 Tax=Curtobacterium herbarum TaxID=150122 RepID=A0ABP4KBI9_9MICO
MSLCGSDGSDRRHVQGARLDGRTLTKSWLPGSFGNRGGTLRSGPGRAGPGRGDPDTEWATAPRDRPQDP